MCYPAKGGVHNLPRETRCQKTPQEPLFGPAYSLSLGRSRRSGSIRARHQPGSSPFLSGDWRRPAHSTAPVVSRADICNRRFHSAASQGWCKLVVRHLGKDLLRTVSKLGTASAPPAVNVRQACGRSWSETGRAGKPAEGSKYRCVAGLSRKDGGGQRWRWDGHLRVDVQEIAKPSGRN